MSRRDGTFTFTFSKRNEDVRLIIAKKKSLDENFVITNYMCEAVRFYETYKDTAVFNNQVDKNFIRATILEVLQELNATGNLEFAATKPIVETISTSDSITNLDDIDDSFLDED